MIQAIGSPGNMPADSRQKDFNTKSLSFFSQPVSVILCTSKMTYS